MASKKRKKLADCHINFSLMGGSNDKLVGLFAIATQQKRNLQNRDPLGEKGDGTDLVGDFVLFLLNFSSIA